MNRIHEYVPDIDRPIWLDVESPAGRHSFELPPDGDRAVVIGSDRHADIRLSSPGVLPVHAYFERESDEVRVVPAGARDVRVNDVLALGPTAIVGSDVVTLAGVHLHVRVVRRPRPPSAPCAA